MKQRFFLTIYLLLLISLAGCKKIDSIGEETKPNEQEVTLRLLMPQQNSTVSTYAISEVGQNSIHHLDVLAFRIADDGKEYYAYHKKAVLLRPNQGATTLDFHVDLLKSKDKFRFVLIANAATQLQTALNGLPANTEKETVMSRITYGITTKWNAGSSGNFTPLPMWGESETIDGINNNTQKFSVNMLRSLAAIDVQVTANDFVMTQVYVYNMSGKGRIAPLPGNYDANEYEVKAPSIPAGTNRLTAQEYVSGTKGLAGEIFLFESAAPGNTGDSNATGLVIAGKYAGSTVVTYYRVELTDDQQKLLPVLRNHRYVIDITKVHAAGYNSAAAAWASKPVNMTATVTAWNEIPGADSNMPLQYLKVDVAKVGISGLQGETTFTIWTNAPTSAVNLTLPLWLVNLGSNRVGNKITYKFFVAQNNSTTTVRSGNINVKVGRLTGTVDVKQGARPIDLGPDYGFYVFANDLLYAAFWFRVANVQDGNVSALDASLTQKEGEPYPESCVANLGPGARLPTIQELRQLMPTDHNARLAVNQAISAQKGTGLIYFQTSGAGSLTDPYLSSSSATVLDPTSSNTVFLMIRSNLGAAYDTDRKFPLQGYGNNKARCVISK
ncbi:hypothetical protein HMPREF0765_3582 [Sphingobacterium spiritivorum ATCC 33300]|uniref:Major fimbrial subunit protein N-terminal domain-containing protein n=1 Tax=Sphingobacterium spiritivorum ATCC 33300 TaxID=525372 RepID=C2G1X6_SPHSI|nr:BACON domain-containing protein [Sphingobacterium spiritivorum]EEI90822.1 hypothetical protein HMPREF0765_3582 [Sphingobacterium spiritivorum ATCC 33300]QQS97089.1 BACON domain-containing protein [Sphingobacterium spiritivorum]